MKEQKAGICGTMHHTLTITLPPSPRPPDDMVDHFNPELPVIRGPHKLLQQISNLTVRDQRVDCHITQFIFLQHPISRQFGHATTDYETAAGAGRSMNER